MSARSRWPLVAIVLSFCALLGGCNRKPTGFDRIVKLHGGKHVNLFVDPAELAKPAAEWVQSPEEPLAFFVAKLDSNDPSEVKASMLSIAILARAIDYTGPDQVSAETKAKFDRGFPVDKLNQLLDLHPEYAEWLGHIQATERGRAFPVLQSWKP